MQYPRGVLTDFSAQPMRIQYAKTKSDAVARLDGTYQPRQKRASEEKRPEKKRKAEEKPSEKRPEKRKAEEKAAAAAAAAVAAPVAPVPTPTVPAQVLCRSIRLVYLCAFSCGRDYFVELTRVSAATPAAAEQDPVRGEPAAGSDAADAADALPAVPRLQGGPHGPGQARHRLRRIRDRARVQRRDALPAALQDHPRAPHAHLLRPPLIKRALFLPLPARSTRPVVPPAILLSYFTSTDAGPHQPLV